MTQKHTQGPWELYQNSICTSDGKANEIAKITRHGVWMGDNSPYGARNTIGDANAQLIAAAPEILGALEQLVSLFPYFPAGSEERKALELAQEAIAKATGQDVQETAQ